MCLSGDQKKVAADFPEVIWLPEHHICIFRPEGELTGRVVARTVEWLEAIERDIPKPFDRFSDLTKLATINLTPFDVENVAFWRRTIYAGPVVRSAFLAGSDESRQVAEKYASLMEGSRILVSVFRSIKDAARWLHVPQETIEEQKSSGSEGPTAPRNDPPAG